MKLVHRLLPPKAFHRVALEWLGLLLTSLILLFLKYGFYRRGKRSFELNLIVVVNTMETCEIAVRCSLHHRWLNRVSSAI